MEEDGRDHGISGAVRQKQRIYLREGDKDGRVKQDRKEDLLRLKSRPQILDPDQGIQNREREEVLFLLEQGKDRNGKTLMGGAPEMIPMPDCISGDGDWRQGGDKRIVPRRQVPGSERINRGLFCVPQGQ